MANILILTLTRAWKWLLYSIASVHRGINLCTAVLQHFSGVKVWIFDWDIVEPWFFLFFIHSVADLLLWLESLSYSMSSLGQALAVTFDSTEEFMVDSVSVRCQLLWPENKLKSSPLHHHAWTAGLRCLCWYAMFWFSPNVLLCVMIKHRHIRLVWPADIIP